jgi:hypothetical protein
VESRLLEGTGANRKCAIQFKLLCTLANFITHSKEVRITYQRCMHAVKVAHVQIAELEIALTSD